MNGGKVQALLQFFHSRFIDPGGPVKEAASVHKTVTDCIDFYPVIVQNCDDLLSRQAVGGKVGGFGTSLTLDRPIHYRISPGFSGHILGFSRRNHFWFASIIRYLVYLKPLRRTTTIKNEDIHKRFSLYFHPPLKQIVMQ
jgi:hypothetical protein